MPYGTLSIRWLRSAPTTDDLGVEVLLGDHVVEVRHPVRLEPQREVERPGRHHLEVVGAVERRRRVEHAADALDQREVLARLDVARALEHQVLEEVGEALPVRLLVARADVVPEVDGDDARGPGSG